MKGSLKKRIANAACAFAVLISSICCCLPLSAAAQEQLVAIRRIVKEYGSLDVLPEPLRDAALLRITNPEASLADLAELSFPKVSKSCLSHRLKKLMSYKPEE